MGITVCILVKNDALMLEGCLKNIHDHVEEIIVVDNGSTDNSIDIAKKYDCKIIKETYLVQDAARNIYLRAASQPWILILDCDERVELQDIIKMRETISNAKSNVMGFTLLRYEYLGSGQWALSKQPRLIRSHPKIRYNDVSIHASLLPSIDKLGGKVINLDAYIHHLDTLIHKGRTNQKRQSYFNKLLFELKREDLSLYEKSNIYHFIGLEYTINSDFEKGEVAYKEAIDIDETNTLARLFLTQNYLARNKLKDALHELTILVDAVGETNDAILTIFAEIAYRQNDLLKAENICEKALEAFPNYAHWHINYASIVSRNKPLNIEVFLDELAKLNPYIKKTVIYSEGDKPNLFMYQNSFLSSTKPLLNRLYNHLTN